jgi:hypothetical protein
MAPIGPPVDPLPSGRAPGRGALHGAHVRLEPVDVAAHASSLHALAHAKPEDAAIWTYLAYGPFPDRGAFERWLAERARSEDPLFFAIVDRASGAASGMAAELGTVLARIFASRRVSGNLGSASSRQTASAPFTSLRSE